MEIGGFFEYPKLDHISGDDSVYQQLTEGYKNFQWVRDGRQSIKTALLNIKDIKNLTCYLPAYLSKSILQPFHELNLNYKFYGHSDVLKPEIKEIKDSVLFLLDYFGRDTLSNKEIHEFLDRNNTVILDTTHSILNHERFEIKDENFYIISSLRKIFPISDGGILYNVEESKIKPDGQPDGHVKMLEAMIFRSYYLNKLKLGYSDDSKTESVLKDRTHGKILSIDHSLRIIKNNFLSQYKDYERKKFEYFGMPQNIPAISLHIMKNLSYSKIVKKRRENLKFFYDEIEDYSKFLFDFKDIKSPFMLPLKFQTENERNSHKDILIKNDIYTPLLWDLDEIVPKEHSYEHELRKRIMMVPIDQRYNPDDLLPAVELINSHGA
jgi:hypothetical protein